MSARFWDEEGGMGSESIGKQDSDTGVHFILCVCTTSFSLSVCVSVCVFVGMYIEYHSSC